MTMEIHLSLFAVFAFVSGFLAVICHQIGRMSGGKIKFLEESEPTLADKLGEVFPLKDEYVFAARLLVAGFLIAAFYFLSFCIKEKMQLSYLWIPLTAAAGCYWLMEILLGLLSTKASARLIIAFVPFFMAASWLLYPLTMPYGVMRRKLGAKRLENEDGDTAPSVEDEILSLVEGETAAVNATIMQALEEDEKRMIRGALELDEVSVRKIMTPRVDVVCVEYRDGMSNDEFVSLARDTIVQSGHSRIPVYVDSIDNIIGIVYSKDLLDSAKLDVFDSFVRKKLLVIPISKNIGDLLEEFRQSKIHLAIVVDEYGGTAGIVTIEDVLETLVGDIQDEYDYTDNEEDLDEVSQGVWKCDARTAVEMVNKVLNVEIPEDDEYDTVGGYLSFTAGRIPLQGETIETPVLSALILKADGRRAIEVELSPVKKDEQN